MALGSGLAESFTTEAGGGLTQTLQAGLSLTDEPFLMRCTMRCSMLKRGKTR